MRRHNIGETRCRLSLEARALAVAWVLAANLTGWAGCTARSGLLNGRPTDDASAGPFCSTSSARWCEDFEEGVDCADLTPIGATVTGAPDCRYTGSERDGEYAAAAFVDGTRDSAEFLGLDDRCALDDGICEFRMVFLAGAGPDAWQTVAHLFGGTTAVVYTDYTPGNEEFVVSLGCDTGDERLFIPLPLGVRAKACVVVDWNTDTVSVALGDPRSLGSPCPDDIGAASAGCSSGGSIAGATIDAVLLQDGNSDSAARVWDNLELY